MYNKNKEMKKLSNCSMLFLITNMQKNLLDKTLVQISHYSHRTVTIKINKHISHKLILTITLLIKDSNIMSIQFTNNSFYKKAFKKITVWPQQINHMPQCTTNK